MKKKTAKGNRVKKNVEPELIELGQRLRKLRIERGFSSAEKFAIEHDLSRVAYTKAETGSNLTYITLRKLLKIFKVSLKDFFSEGFK